jgi:predicted MFS family arabinose efflux permease
MIGRTGAILVGIAVTFTLEQLLGFRWYFAFLFGIAVYLLVRYVAYFVAERRLIRASFEASARKRP